MIEGELSAWEVPLAAYQGALWIVLALVASCLVAVGFALVAGPRAGSRRTRWVAIGPALILTAQSVVVLTLLTWFFRQQALEWALHGAPTGVYCACTPTLHPLLGMERMLTLWAVVLCVAVPGVLWALSRVAPLGAPLLRSLACVALVTGAVAVSVQRMLDIPRWHLHAPSVRDYILENALTLDALVWIPAAVGALAFVCLAARGLRGGPALTRSWREPGLAFGFVAIAALAFVGTRGHAHDRHHPVSLIGERLPPSTPIAPAWMSSEVCDAPPLAPVLELAPGNGSLDGRYVDPDQLQADLETMARNWDVLHPDEPFPGVLLVAAPLSMSWPELEPWLAAAHRAGYARVGFVLARPREVRTDALGTVAVASACVVFVETQGPLGESYSFVDRPYPELRWPDLGEALHETAYNVGVRVVYLRSLPRQAW